MADDPPDELEEDDITLLSQIQAMDPIKNSGAMAEAFELILGVPAMETSQDEIDWSDIPSTKARRKAKDGMQSAIDTLKDQAAAQAEVIRSFINSLRDRERLTGDTSKDIN